jgi:uncharacterized Zn-binding protein involved in type VI secretion
VTRHGIPPGYTPPVTHDPVTCWRCGGRLADDPVSTGHEVIRIGGRNVAAHKPGNVECVPRLVSPRKEAQ